MLFFFTYCNLIRAEHEIAKKDDIYTHRKRINKLVRMKRTTLNKIEPKTKTILK
jgi:hypothetical protein